MERLLEREGELLRLDRAIQRAGASAGSTVVIAGPAGIGKSSLLQAATERALVAGFAVLTATGGELERGIGFGVVRQLFEERLRRLPAAQRRELLSGAAGFAAPAVMAEMTTGSTAVDTSAVLHGLYWLVANLAAGAPVVVAVDDLQWADPASVRFLLYLARRVKDLEAVIVACVRPDEPSSPESPWEKFVAATEIDVLRPQPLSETAVGRIVATVLAKGPDARFVNACWRMTGGTPFYVHALAGALRENGIEPVSGSVRRIGELGPEKVGQATMERLARMVPAAGAVTSAAAVLGADAELPRVARLAGVDHDSALSALDALITAGILEPGRPLRFAHPIVRASVYNRMSTAERSRTHARAAELLAAEGAAHDTVALHLVASEPSGQPGVVDRLRAAATEALARGAPDSAVVYLRRALEEGPDRESRAELLFELGAAQKLVRDPAGAESLDLARGLSIDPVLRARCALELADVLVFSGRWSRAFAVIDAGVKDAAGVDPELATRLETSIVLASLFDANTASDADRYIPALRAAANDRSAAPEVLLTLAAVDGLRGGHPQAVADLVRRGLDGGRFLAGRPGAWMLAQAFAALVFMDQLEEADAMLEAMQLAARSNGSAPTFVTVASGRLWLGRRRGELRGLGEELRAAVARGQEHGFGPAVALWFGVDALLECDGLDDLAELAMSVELPAPLRQGLAGAELAEVKGRLLFARGERQRGMDQLRLCGEILTGLSAQPGVSCWRSMLALALARDDQTGARDLVSAELAQARAVGLPRAIGIALRTLGLIEGGDRGIEHLRNAETVLRESSAKLEHARALVELGAALRRANQRAAAREPLRLGLDLADRCGATRLADRANFELVAAGARPKRLALTGRDSLTPSELRVAAMAAHGLTNAEIAQALFVSAKTVENQLGRVYKKLGILGRTQLPDALET